MRDEQNLTAKSEPSKRWLKESWSKQVRTGLGIRNVRKLMECMTYDPPGKFTTGLDSEVDISKRGLEKKSRVKQTFLQLSFLLDTTKFWYLFVYIHEREQNILVATPLYGNAFLQLPEVEWSLDDEKFTRFTYIVRTVKHTVMPKKELPCFEVTATDFVQKSTT